VRRFPGVAYNADHEFELNIEGTTAPNECQQSSAGEGPFTRLQLPRTDDEGLSVQPARGEDLSSRLLTEAVEKPTQGSARSDRTPKNARKGADDRIIFFVTNLFLGRIYPDPFSGRCAPRKRGGVRAGK
jgi:hypothetical protein